MADGVVVSMSPKTKPRDTDTGQTLVGGSAPAPSVNPVGGVETPANTPSVENKLVGNEPISVSAEEVKGVECVDRVRYTDNANCVMTWLRNRLNMNVKEMSYVVEYNGVKYHVGYTITVDKRRGTITGNIVIVKVLPSGFVKDVIAIPIDAFMSMRDLVNKYSETLWNKVTEMRKLLTGE